MNATLSLPGEQRSFLPDLSRLFSPLLILSGVAILARMATFGNPLVQVDEQFYLLAARDMLHGQLLYVDIWDRKPVGLFLLYGLAALFPVKGAIIAYQAMATAFVIATALAIRQIARQAGWAGGATAAAIFYILWLNLGEGQGGQSPIFYNFLTAGAVSAMLRAIRSGPGTRQWRPAGLTAMALVGVAIQIKYNVLFEGMLFGMWLCLGEWRAHRQLAPVIGLALALMGVALAPTIAAGLYYLTVGHFPEFFFANFLSIFHRSGQVPDLGRNAITLALLLAPGIAMALWPVPRGASSTPSDREVPIARFLQIWLAVSLGAVVLFGTYFEHYSLPVMLPAACCAARFLGSRKQAGTILLLLLGAGGQIAIYRSNQHFGDGRAIQPVVDAIGKAPGQLYVYSGPSALYLLTGRAAPSRWVLPDHLSQTTESHAVGVDTSAEIDHILASQPEWIVAAPPKNGENFTIRAKIYRFIAHHYHLAGDYPVGQQSLSLFRLNETG